MFAFLWFSESGEERKKKEEGEEEEEEVKGSSRASYVGEWLFEGLENLPFFSLFLVFVVF